MGLGTHGHKWSYKRWMVLHCTPQLSTCKPSWCPPHSDEGVSCHQGWQPPRPERWPRREPSVPVCPLSYGSGGFWINIFGLLRGLFGHGGSGVRWCLLAGCWAINIAAWVWVPHKSWYNSSTLDLATANSTFWRPAVSRCWASLCKRLAWCNMCRPWKEKRKEICYKSQV